MSTETQRTQIDGLRTMEERKIKALIVDALRHHTDTLHPTLVADLFAFSEIKHDASTSSDMKAWVARTSQEIRDIPDNGQRAAWLHEIGQIPAGLVPARLREVVLGLAGSSGGGVIEQIDALAAVWANTPPTPLVLPKAVSRLAAKAEAKAPKAPKAVKEPKAPRAVKVPRTPAAQIDPRRAEWVRDDAHTRLTASEYAERGLKESIFLGGIRHRSPFKDITDEEIKTVLRRMEREGILKHTGERWLAR